LGIHALVIICFKQLAGLEVGMDGETIFERFA